MSKFKVTPPLVLSCALALLFCTTANAALISRLDGQAYYDDVLDITWLADANYAKTSGYDLDGYMNKEDSLLWADQLVFGGVNNWRIAGRKKTTPPETEACIGYNCTDSEMSYMYYVNLGGDSGLSKLTGNQGPFKNIRAEYWSDISLDSLNSVNYHFSDGLQFKHPNYFEYAAWAVMDGDIQAVPIPAAIWLFSSGLLGLISMVHRKAV